MDDKVDLERTADVLRRLDADIIALQEVDERVARSGGVDQAARLGDLLAMHHAFAGFMEYQGGRYGMAILSRCEIRSARPLRLTDGNEPRVALAVEIAPADGAVITVANIHFDWVADDGFRFTQASEVARYLDGVATPWIAIGDFNDLPGSRTIDLFHTRAGEAAKPRDRRHTFPSSDPQKEIDFIFVAPRDRWSVGAVEVVGETLASDHRPVLASLVLNGRGDADAGRRASELRGCTGAAM